MSGLLARRLTPALLQQAWARVRRHPSPGVDGVGLRAVERDRAAFLATIHADLLRGDPRPAPVLHVSVPKKSGGLRDLGIPTLRDRTAQVAVHLALRADLDRRFAPEVHGYRFGHGPQTAIVHLQRQVGRRPWIELVKADVASLFDNLDHRYLLAQVDAASPDPLWRHLARCWIAAWPHHPGHGVPQGAPLSPLFANLYLAAGVDRHLQKGDARGLIGWIRYGDDLVLAAQRPGHGPALLAWLDGLVRGCRLELGPAKTVLGCQRLGATWPATVLGYRIRFVQGRDRRWSLVILDEDHAGALPAESWLDAPRLGAGAFARLRAPWWWRGG